MKTHRVIHLRFEHFLSRNVSDKKYFLNSPNDGGEDRTTIGDFGDLPGEEA
jgi:hypothetical protein